METTLSTNVKNVAAMLHLSAMLQYMIPFGNFIFPVVIWSSMKEKSAYIDQQGKRAINFHLSLFLYAALLCVIAVPVFLINFIQAGEVHVDLHDGHWLLNHLSTGHLTAAALVIIFSLLLFFALMVAEFFLIIYASVKASRGEDFKYPLTINFIK